MVKIIFLFCIIFEHFDAFGDFQLAVHILDCKLSKYLFINFDSMCNYEFDNNLSSKLVALFYVTYVQFVYYMSVTLHALNENSLVFSFVAYLFLALLFMWPYDIDLGFVIIEMSQGNSPVNDLKLQPIADKPTDTDKVMIYIDKIIVKMGDKVIELILDCLSDDFKEYVCTVYKKVCIWVMPVWKPITSKISYIKNMFKSDNDK